MAMSAEFEWNAFENFSSDNFILEISLGHL